MARAKREDKVGELRFYCSRCLGAAEGMVDFSVGRIFCFRHITTEVIPMREMIRPHGTTYYVSVDRKTGCI